MANISQVKLPSNSIYDIVPVINPNNTVIDASVHVGPYPLDANSLCMVATDGMLYPFVQTLGTNTNSTYSNIPADIKFRIGTDVFAAGKAYDGSAGAIDVSTLAISKEVDIRYSSRRLTGASGTSYSAIPAGQHNEIYIYVTVHPSTGTFSLASNYMEGFGNPSTDWHVNILAKEKVKANTFCMFLGYSSSYSTYYKVWLSPEHPIYYCDSERNFIPYNTWKNNIQDTSISLINTRAYKNPVAGYDINNSMTLVGERRFVANSSIIAQLVFEGTDNSIYSIEQRDVSINPDWGLAYWNGEESALDVNDVIQQESLLISDTNIEIDTTNLLSMQYFPVYAWFKYTNNTIKSTVDSSVLHPTIPLATDSSNDTYVYVGTAECIDNHVKYLHMDLSNHDFITLGNKYTSSSGGRTITAINGKLLEGASTSGGNYNNPVSGAGANPVAAYNLARFDFVCYDVNVDGLVPLHCYWDGTLSVSGISYDWGLAFCNANVTRGNIPPEGTILQQITLSTATVTGKPMPMYIFFDSDGMIIGNDQGNYPIFVGQAEPPRVYELTPITPDNKQLTQIYVGIWSGDKFHIDLSNHDFITYGESVTPGSNPGVYGPINSSGPCIAYINGKPFKDPNASTGGATLDGQGYGLCNSYDQGGVTPRSGETPGSGGSGSGSGPWTALATTHNGYVPTPYSVVAIYTTVEFYPDAYLNINNTGAYPVYYAGSPLLTGVIEGNSMTVFMFQDGRYNLIAGGASNNTLDPTLYERKVNKVSSAVGLSSSSTDTQYPSAKCVYNIIGDIETLLAAI